MPESLEWGFRPEIGLSDLPKATVEVADLHQFANTLDGYKVWGDYRAVQAVSEHVVRRLEAGTPCASVLKLRTALFWLARTARLTDEVGPSLMPEEATFEREMRTVLEKLRACMSGSSADVALFVEALQAAAADIPVSGRFVESNLRDRIVSAMNQIAEAKSAPGLAAAAEVTMGQLLGWDPADPPGKFDVAFGPSNRDGLTSDARLLAEVKWSDHNTLSHSLWDAAKLIGALASRADHVILVGGWPTTVWERAPCAALYQSGLVDYAALTALPGEWPSLHKHGQGRAVAVPRELRVKLIATVSIPRGEETWELRAVTIEPAAAGWLWLNDGLIEGAVPLDERDEAP